MITKMKKYLFLVFHNDYDAFLEELRGIGLIHVEQKQKGSSLPSGLQDSIDKVSKYQDVINALSKFKGGVTSSVSDTPLEDYYDIISKKEASKARLQELKQDRAKLLPWGEFDMEKLRALSGSNCCIKFHSCAKKTFKPSWEDEYNAFVINEDKANVYFITIETDDSKHFPGEGLQLPSAEPGDTEREILKLEKELAGVDVKLAGFAAANLEKLIEEKRNLLEEIDLSKVKLDTEEGCEQNIMILNGWAPASDTERICRELDGMECFYETADPTPEDDIPILMSNNRFFRLFEPLTKLYMLPAYGELDLTPFFAPFFMLFFGLCLGDMGYGLLMILAMPVFDKLFKLINPDFSKWLVPLFGASTMLCGLLTGTAFGFSLYDLDIPFLQKMKGIFYQDNATMFTLSLIIGVVQILFGMILKAVNKTIQFGFVYALSTIGWIILLCTVGIAFISGIGFNNPIVISLLVVSGILIFLLNSPGKNPFLNIGLGLWDSYNMVTGLLGDVLSYVRLFALGLSGGILASVFNSLSVGMSPDVPVVGFLVTALIFVAGHAINIFMNFLGAIVHPMRLTFVEFFKNAGYSGGSTEYKPFKSIDKQ